MVVGLQHPDKKQKHLTLLKRSGVLHLLFLFLGMDNFIETFTHKQPSGV